MSDSNVGAGWIPCRPNCQCNECTIDRLLCRIRDLEAQLARVREPTEEMIDAGRKAFNEALQIDAPDGWGLVSVFNAMIGAALQSAAWASNLTARVDNGKRNG